MRWSAALRLSGKGIELLLAESPHADRMHVDPAARRRRRPVEARGDHAEDHTEGHIDYP